MDERALGRLEAQVENLTRVVKETSEDATVHREGVRQELSRLNDQIGPMNMSLTELGRKVIAQGNILRTYEDRRIEFRGLLRGGKWLARTAWITFSGVLILWGEHIKAPFIKLLELFK